MKTAYLPMIKPVLISAAALAVVFALGGCSAAAGSAQVGEKQERARTGAEDEGRVSSGNTAPSKDRQGEAAFSDLEGAENEKTGFTLDEGRAIETEYAENFSIREYEDGYYLVTLMDGRKFLSLPEGRAVPVNAPEDAVILRRPLGDIYIAGSGSMDYFAALGALDSVAFCSGRSDEWSVDGVREAMDGGKMVYAGKYRDPDYELLLSSGCTLAVENTMIFHSPQTEEKLIELGIPVLVDYASYESHPFGRMEWIKLYGALLGCEDRAADIYEKQRDMAVNMESTGKKVAFFHIDDSGAVVVRRSDDYIPRMIEMAGGSYVFTDLTGEGRLSTESIQMEEFYSAARDADYLIYNALTSGGVGSVEGLLAKNSLFKDFKAVKEDRVYEVDRDFYQNTMSLGTMVRDMNRMMKDEEELTFLKKL